MASQIAAGGTGPLYEHTPEGKRAAEEDVVIPHPEDRADTETNPTGEDQARINREDDPPA
jgi:hypothetical protein